MASYDVLFPLCLSACFWLPVFTQLCSPPPGSTPVYDACAIAQSSSVPNNTLSTSAALYNSIDGISIANLMSPVPVIADAPAYDGGIGFALQNVTVVEALTAMLRVAHNGTLALFDQTQLLAAGLFEASIDYYPNVQLPYLYSISTYLVDIDVSTSNIDTDLQVTNLVLGDIRDLLTTISGQLSVNIPTSMAFTQTVSATTPLSIAQILADTLYLPSVNNINGANTGSFIEYISLARLLGIPYLDPFVNPASASCTTSSSATGPEFPFGVMYGQPTQVDASQPNWSQSSSSKISGLLIESISRCYSESFGSNERDNRFIQFAPTSTVMASNSYIVT